MLGNDTDVDGDPLTAAVVPATGPFNGTLTLGPDGSFTYTPDPDFSGSDTFSYQADDGNGGSDSAAFIIHRLDRFASGSPPTMMDGCSSSLLVQSRCER